MKEEWNENIELILASKTYEELSPEDKETLGEIAVDKVNYDRYRQLFTTVLPAVKADQVSTHTALDQRIESIADEDSRRGVWHQKWFQFSAAAAVLLLLLSGTFWFLNQNQVGHDQQENELAHNKPKEIYRPEKSADSKTEEVSAKEKNSTQSSEPKTTEVFSESNEAPSPDRSAKSETIEAPKVEMDMYEPSEREASRSFKALHHPDEESLAASEDLSDKDESPVVSYEESDEAVAFKDNYGSGSVIGSNQQVSRSAAPTNERRDHLRNDIVGTITLAKSASEDENAFKVLTIAF